MFCVVLPGPEGILYSPNVVVVMLVDAIVRPEEHSSMLQISFAFMYCTVFPWGSSRMLWTHVFSHFLPSFEIRVKTVRHSNQIDQCLLVKDWKIYGQILSMTSAGGTYMLPAQHATKQPQSILWQCKLLVCQWKSSCLPVWMCFASGCWEEVSPRHGVQKGKWSLNQRKHPAAKIPPLHVEGVLAQLHCHLES